MCIYVLQYTHKILMKSVMYIHKFDVAVTYPLLESINQLSTYT